MSVDLIKLKELAEKATLGEWHTEYATVYDKNDDAFVFCISSYEENMQAWNNADYIAAANPKVIIELINEVEWLKKENECLKTVLAMKRG